MGATIGIDLGTTNSCAAIVKEGKPRVITDTGGGFTIPSVVAMDEKGNRLVGQSAKRQSLINPVNTIYGAKRLIGRRYSSRIMDNVRNYFTYDMAQGDNEDVLIKMSGEVYGLDEVSALIIDKVRNTAQDIIQEEITRAVVTVPAYFNDRQRQAVKDAGKIAEIEVLRIINEPTAAALAYGWGKQLQEKVAVYDLGGGTFDISLLEVRSNVYEVRATGGDTFLGGVDFDNRLMDYVSKRFYEETNIDLSKDTISLQRIKDASERAKIDLSTKQDVRINIPFIAMGANGPVNIDMIVTREQLESLVEDLVVRTLETCKQVLADSGWSQQDVQEVLLVGGQTRMPFVQEKVEEFFGRTPSKGVHPDEAVAIGAAIMAYSLTEGSDYKITLIDVIPMSIGVMLAQGRFHKIFPRNTTIPNATSMVFTTSKDQQTQLKLKIFQGENEKASENELLGEFVFSGIPPAPKGNARIEVILKLTPEGMLTVEAQDPETRKWIETSIAVSSGISQKTHHTKLIEKKAPPIQKKETKSFASTTSPPRPPPARMIPKPPPAKKVSKTEEPVTPPPEPVMEKAGPKEKTPPPFHEKTPPPQKIPVSEKTPPPERTPSPLDKTPPPGMAGVQTVTTRTGRVVMRRDPITGQIIKNPPVEGSTASTPPPEQPKREFKRYHPPPPPPGLGEKISGWFKGLLGKK